MKALILHIFMNFSAYKHVIRRNEGPAQKERSRTQARSYKMGWNQSFRRIQSYFETVVFSPALCLIYLSKNVSYNSVIWFTYFFSFINSHTGKSQSGAHLVMSTLKDFQNPSKGIFDWCLFTVWLWFRLRGSNYLALVSH